MSENCKLKEIRPFIDRIKKSKVRAKLVFLLVSLTALFVCALAQDNDSNYTSNKADYWYNKGLMLAGAGSYDEAYRAYDKAIQLNPDNPGAWNGEALTLRALSFSRHDLHEYNESLKAFDKSLGLYDVALKADPQDANNWYYEGLALSDRATTTLQASKIFNISPNEQDTIGYFEEAVKAYDNATNISPRFAASWKNKGNILYALGKYNESIGAYDKATEIVPGYALAWYGKGLALAKIAKYDAAVQSYDKAIENDPKNAEMWYSKGIALSIQSKYDDAVKCYDKAVQLDQSYAEAWYGRGVAFEKLGFEVEAKANIAKARQLGYKA